MAVALSNFDSAIDSGGSAYTQDLSFDCGAGSGRILCAWGFCTAGPIADGGFEVVGGAAFTDPSINFANGSVHLRFFYLVDPPSGTNTLRVTSTNGLSQFPGMQVMLFDGVDTSEDIEDLYVASYDTVSGRTMDTNVSVPVDGMTAVGNVLASSFNFTWNSPNTETEEIVNTGNHICFSGATAPGTGGIVTNSVTYSSTCSYATIFGVTLNPSIGGGGGGGKPVYYFYNNPKTFVS
jgi:hypothetical protein